ncbi:MULTISPECIES: SGNH/GDSL hydrolase family protein [unclassified Rhodococcus (in: high G+C Gram-positive bacteria)]|uniref:SGNH/GDSL hydrolase family protein n=1 Tax=unclassified Rhodococcus (in: high G+C Gram-positive bacteria) TaxID=192944 RepID=UPI0009E7AFEE|nr:MULTISPECIES: SGNH/GDSL hydrolase family protein [unclassified Rhodococcus (in: high G+C Gram-positive bacteria)]
MSRSRIGIVLTAAVAAVVLTGGSATAAPTPQVYVALGDSFAAGSGIAPQTPSGICGRSGVNYPSLLARDLQIPVVRDVTCGSAESANLAGPQRGPGGIAEPQYDALSTDTTLVTVGIGGNDIQLVQLAARCIALPLSAPCATVPDDTYPSRIDAFAATYDTVLDEVARRAPAARVLMVGYPTGIRPGGCPDRQPVRPTDATYLQARIDQLNDVMEAAADRHGATYVDLAESSRDHDVCAEDSWMVGIVPTSLDAFVPLHPTAAGHANAARQIEAVLR